MWTGILHFLSCLQSSTKHHFQADGLKNLLDHQSLILGHILRHTHVLHLRLPASHLVLPHQYT